MLKVFPDLQFGRVVFCFCRQRAPERVPRIGAQDLQQQYSDSVLYLTCRDRCTHDMI